MLFVLTIKNEVVGVFDEFDKAWDKGWELTEKATKCKYQIYQCELNKERMII